MNNYFRYNCITLLIMLGMHQAFGQQPSVNRVNKTLNKSTTGVVKSFNPLNFEFRDSLDRKVLLSEYKGKYLLVDIWYTGCGACISTNQGLKVVHSALKNDNIIFFSISVDKNKDFWLESVRHYDEGTKLNHWAGKYEPAMGTKILYTGGTGENNDFIKKFVPTRAYPQLLLIDPKGEIISNNPPRPDYDPVNLICYLKEFVR